MTKLAFMKMLPKVGVFLLTMLSLLVSSYETETYLLRGKLQEAASDIHGTTSTSGRTRRDRTTSIKSPTSMVRVFHNPLFSNSIEIISV